MLSRTRTLVLLVLLGCSFFASRLSAQKPGDAVVMGFLTIFCHNVFVYCVDPNSGQFTTLFPPSCGFDKGSGITAFPGNDGVLFPTLPDSTGRFQFHHHSAAGTKVVGTLDASFTMLPDIRVDQSGDLIVLARRNPTSLSGLYRFAVDGSVKATLATGLTGAVAMEEELTSGDFVVVMPGGDVLRVTRQGVVSTVAIRVLPGATPGLGANLRTEFGAGQMLVAWNQSVFRFDPLTGGLTTLLQDTMNHIGLAHDPVHGHYYRTDQNALVRYDPATGATVQVMAFPSVSIPGDVATWGSRMLTGTASPTPGSSYPLTLTMTGEAGQAYQVAASFSTRPGIPTPAGTIHLTPDGSFFCRSPIRTCSRVFPACSIAQGRRGPRCASRLCPRFADCGSFWPRCRTM